mmetsp:Transcript_5886/g.12841  ORF Transcript_5886/g.12841 Transcript_5886/m.12841 type:complete len:233 (-) Transcript_5886:913-1611(-)
MSSVLDLLLRNVHCSSVVSRHHELLETQRAGNIAPLANVQEWKPEVVVNILHLQVFKSRQPHLRTTHVGKFPRLIRLRHLPDRLDVRWRGSAASSDHIQPTILKEHLVRLRHVIRTLVVSSHGIGQSGIRVHMQETLHAFGQLLHKWRHVLGPKGTVQTHTHRLGMADRSIESLSSLSGEGTTRLINQSSGHKHRNIQTTEFQVLSDRIQSRLCIQSIEDCLNHQNISSSIH